MASSKRGPAGGWTRLLEQPGGPKGVHDRILQLARDQAAGDALGVAGTVVGLSSRPLAAIAALRGPADCRQFLAAVSPKVEQLDHQLSMFPDSIDEDTLLSLLALHAIAESVGGPIEIPDLDLEVIFGNLVLSKGLNHSDRANIALLSLGMGRVRDVELMFDKGAPPRLEGVVPELVALIRALAAAVKASRAAGTVEPQWEAFLSVFPAGLEAEQAEWRHLLLAARVVFAKLGASPPDQVAELLHRRLVELAAKESA